MYTKIYWTKHHVWPGRLTRVATSAPAKLPPVFLTHYSSQYDKYYTNKSEESFHTFSIFLHGVALIMAVVQDRDKLCSSCKQIPPIKEIIGGSFPIWANFQEFKASALNGCPFCSFLYKAAKWAKFDTSRLHPGLPLSLIWNGAPPWMRSPDETPNIRMEADSFGENMSIFVDPGKRVHP